MNTIAILWLRQLKRYVRSRARMIGSLGQPILFLVALGFGLGPIFERAGQGNYLQFISPGVIGMAIIFTAMFAGIEIIWDRQFGFLKETLVAPVSRFTIMIGRTLGGTTVSALQGAVVFVITLFAGFRPTLQPQLLLAPVFMILIALLFTALGTTIAVRMQDMQAFPLIMNFVIMPLFFLSSALFPIAGLPKGLMIAVKLNPLTYGIDGLRGSFGEHLMFGFTNDFLVLIVLSSILVWLGGVLFKNIEV